MKPGDLVKVSDTWNSSLSPTIGIITKIGSDSNKIHVVLASGKVTWRMKYELQLIDEPR
jgi:hypothetical protein